MVSLRNDSWGTSHTDDVSLPRSGQCFLLAVPREKFASTNQKHYPDLGSETSSVWNFWARSSDVVSRRNQWWRRECRLLFEATTNGSLSSLTVPQWTWGFHRQANQRWWAQHPGKRAPLSTELKSPRIYNEGLSWHDPDHHPGHRCSTEWKPRP